MRHARKKFLEEKTNILLLLITACVSMEENVHAIANQKLLIVINDVPAIKLSVNCCDCASKHFLCLHFVLFSQKR